MNKKTNWIEALAATRELNRTLDEVEMIFRMRRGELIHLADVLVALFHL